MKKTVMVTMSADEFRELLNIIENLTSNEDLPYGYTTEAHEKCTELRKALNAAEGEKSLM